MNRIIAIAIILIATLIGAFGALYIKKGAEKCKIAFSFHKENLFIIIGGGLYFFSLLMYIVALKFIPLSIAYPLTSISYLWIALLSSKYLGERMDRWKWAGIMLIIAGIVLVSFP